MSSVLDSQMRPEAVPEAPWESLPIPSARRRDVSALLRGDRAGLPQRYGLPVELLQHRLAPIVTPLAPAGG